METEIQQKPRRAAGGIGGDGLASSWKPCPAWVCTRIQQRLQWIALNATVSMDLVRGLFRSTLPGWRFSDQHIATESTPRTWITHSETQSWSKRSPKIPFDTSFWRQTDSATFLELIVLDRPQGPAIIHAMTMTEQYRRLLPGGPT